ncbi:hypothetical protein PVAND_005116 [Polypedilum vanderplanki]|uniref:Uncharacterized protein n=1 Tax=Polypedilum vanderplanki TaxID=319348 RepID=A0A9J6BZV6_POLVA|nr:hypothetical protein PVAND_005116 [Polypedilum vanderplanki]
MKCETNLPLMSLLFLLTNVFTIANAKYMININDSVSLQDCSFDDLRTISAHNANPLEIVIQNCHLKDELPNALFIRFHQLRILEITDSHLTNIGDFAFNGLNDMRILSLARNNLTFVRTWSNENLESLHTLDLRRNNITEVHRFAFNRYPKLLKLNLAVNHLKTLPHDLFRIPCLLKHLNLGKNNFKSIDSHTFKHLHKLIHLELKHNEIESIAEDSFVGLTHLKILHLQENKLTTFDQELISNMPRLHHLNLSHNLLLEIREETFEKNEELISLDISHNKFQSFSKLSFKGLEVLEILNASNNAIESIENDIFNDLGMLKLIDFSNNQIKEILSDTVFRSTPLLKSIRLNGNLLQSINTTTFIGLKLEQLDLSCNNLSSDNFLWPEAVEIAYLNLTFNAFSTINSSVLENIIVTDLYENPFTCEWLVEEIFASKNVHYGRDYVVRSRHDLFEATGVACTDQHTNVVHRLIVLETGRDLNDDVMVMSENDKETKCQPFFQNFNYAPVLLWFFSGGIVVLFVYCILKLMRKSNIDDAPYQVTPIVIDEESKYTFNEK